MKERFKAFFKVGFNRFFQVFLLVIGVVWTIIEISTFFIADMETWFPKGYITFMLVIVFALIISFVRLFPAKKYTRKLSFIDTKITIIIGQMFDDHDSHYVIGFNNYFDTLAGDIVGINTLQNNFLKKIYNDDRSKLDAEIKQQLDNFDPSVSTKIESKTLGNSVAYPLGTCISIGEYKKRFFLLAYGHLGNDMKWRSTNKDVIWTSLNNLWMEVKNMGHGIPVAIPLIGSALGRSGLSRKETMNLIITSFILESKNNLLTKELRVYVRPEDLDTISWYEVRDLIKYS